MLCGNEPLLTLIWHKAHSDQRPHISQPHWSKSYLHDKDLFIYQTYYSRLQAFYQLECNIVPLCPRFTMFLRSRTGRARSSHYAKYWIFNGSLQSGLFPAAVLSVKTGGIVFCQVTVCTGKISLLIPPVYILSAKWKKKTGNKSSPLPYQSQILTPNVLAVWLWDWRYLSKAINSFQGEAKANFNSPQRICWYNRLGRAAL